MCKKMKFKVGEQNLNRCLLTDITFCIDFYMDAFANYHLREFISVNVTKIF